MEFQDDLWIEIAKFLDGKSLVMLAATCRWFHRIMMEECIWKYACLRDLQVPDPRKVAFKWIKLYATAFDGSHSFMFRQKEKYIDWMRIGAFFFDSSEALLTEKLIYPVKLQREDKVEKMLQPFGSCVLNNIKTGIWIADLQLVRCPVCDQNTCDGGTGDCGVRLQRICKVVTRPKAENKGPMYKTLENGTMQIVDVRHIELFLNGEYRDGSWEYELIGSHDIKKHADGASGGIFDIKHLKDPTTSELFNLKSWVGQPKDWQPKAMITLHAVAVNTNLQENEGLHIKYHVMRAGAGGEVVSIRLSQQLI